MVKELLIHRFSKIIVTNFFYFKYKKLPTIIFIYIINVIYIH